ncbi:MAG: DNA polymerase III subunit alpha [Bacilli bacterium]|nr:DNA polymerase III subunit alpha [Bacilli bacterium]
MYIPLYNKTTYTFLSSLLNVSDLIEIAISNNLDSIGICDDNLFGAMEFIRKCEKNNLNPLIGLDLKDRLLFAKNYKGYQNLLKIETIKNERELTNLDFKTYKDNLICIPFKEIDLVYEDIFYPLNEENKDKENVIYLNKLLYKNEFDYQILKYLELLRDNLTIINDYEDKVGNYYKIDNSINKKSLENTIKLSKMCDLKLPKYSLNLASFDDSIDSNTYLTNLAYKGLKKRLNDNLTNKYLERLKYELDVIIKMGFANYFLVVYDFIKYAKNKGILVGPGRGSACGSLVSYTLGITDIDPIKYDLLFERFLNIERITMPDIDTDFPDIYRDLVIDYVKEKYGNKHVANIITFGTMGSKLCIRDIGRVMNIALPDIDNISKIIGSRKDNLKDLIKNDIRLQTLIQSDNKIKKLMEVAVRVEGIKRHTSTHAAGIIISNLELDSIVPLTYDEGTNSYISGYEASYLEDLGLLKMDFLGIKNLTTIMEIEESVLKRDNKKISFKDIPLDDMQTIELFQKGDTNGIFQFESVGMKNFLKDLRPNNFLDLSSAIALFRPGPASSIPSFIKRKEGLEEIDYFHHDLEPILKPTYGIIIYQEQIMQIASIIAGYSLGEADILRRAMSKKKKEVLINEREKFINGALKRGYEENLVNKIYDLILKFAEYGFNKSHSIAYTMVSYKMAYLKVHFKKYFYISLLNSVISDTTKTKEYMYEIKKYDLSILKPDINLSSCSYKIHDDKILCPFNIIKGISKLICNKIIDERKENYQDIYDLFSKNTNLTKSNYEILIKSGSLDSFNYTRKTLINNLDSLINYSSLCAYLDKEFVLKPEIIISDEYDDMTLINMEKELYGFYITNHPVLNYKLKDNNIINLNQIEDHFNKYINLIVMIEKTHEIETKKGEKMMFFTGSDEESIGDFTVFPKVYKEYFDIKKGDILKVLGKVEKRNGSYQIIVSKIEKLD